MDPESLSSHHIPLGMLLAAALGFLTGRTREEASEAPRFPKPGERDFIILAMAGGICACLGNTLLTVAVLFSASSFLFLMRMQQKGRHGITTELAALAIFLIGYLCLTEWRTMGILLGIVLALLLANKEEMRFYSLKVISQKEFGDTLKFLALIFVIYPLLPEGAYGPLEFFDPRKIWFFVILVSAVSYAGYFLGKFFGERRGIYITALVGGLASSTAYTGGVAREVGQSPGLSSTWARAVLLGNTVMFPRMLLIAAAFSPAMAAAATFPLIIMTVAGLLAAWLFCLDGSKKALATPMSDFKNPFTLGPALKYGFFFMLVLLLAKVGKHYWGDSGLWVTAGIGGLIDVNAVLLSQAEFFKSGGTLPEQAVSMIMVAAAANTVFKSVLILGSKQPAFYGRVLTGFVFTFAIGYGAMIWGPTLFNTAP